MFDAGRRLIGPKDPQNSGAFKGEVRTWNAFHLRRSGRLSWEGENSRKGESVVTTDNLRAMQSMSHLNDRKYGMLERTILCSDNVEVKRWLPIGFPAYGYLGTAIAS